MQAEGSPKKTCAKITQRVSTQDLNLRGPAKSLLEPVLRKCEPETPLNKACANITQRVYTQDLI